MKTTECFRTEDTNDVDAAADSLEGSVLCLDWIPLSVNYTYIRSLDKTQ